MKKIFLTILLSVAVLTPAFAENMVPVHTEFTASTTSSKALDKRGNRVYLLMQNKDSTNSIRIHFDTASETDGVVIGAGGNWEMTAVPTGEVYIDALGGTPQVAIVEGKR